MSPISDVVKEKETHREVVNQVPVLMYETTFAGCRAARLGTRLAREKLVTRYCAV